FTTVRCRKMALQLGFEKMSLKENTLRCYFVNKPDSPYFESPVFHSILSFIQTQTNKARLKQTGKSFLLIVEEVKTMLELQRFLERMSEKVQPNDHRDITRISPNN
ncbi:MAG TPA: hypothetical protein VJ647_06030, partial [Chitinophagaceae bacterium]|nr:hypothetical protein [Chitinophagaceae bacterium]